MYIINTNIITVLERQNSWISEHSEYGAQSPLN